MKNLDTMNYKDAKDLFDSLNEEVNKIRLISNPTNFQNDPAFSKLIHLREEVRKLLEIVPAHRAKVKVVTIPTLNASGKINESDEAGKYYVDHFIEFRKMANQHLKRAGKGKLTREVYDQAVEDVGGYEGNLVPLLARVKELTPAARVKELTDNYKVGENMEHPKSSMIEQLMPLFEQDLDQAELVLAAKDMGDRLQKMAEDLASMQVEDLMPLVAAMKEQMGPEKAGAFESAADSALSGALDSVKSAKESHDNAVLALQGEAPIETDMDMEGPAPEDEMSLEPGEPEMEVDMGDEEAMAGVEGEPEGREIKAEESVQFLNKAKNILRAYKTIGKLDETALEEAKSVLEAQSEKQKAAFQKMLDAKKDKSKKKGK